MPDTPQKPPRLLVSDIDGTLIHGDENPSAQTITAIHAAQALGLRFVLASGRNAAELQWFVNQMDLQGAYIALGGAYVQDSSTSEILLNETLPYDIARFILDLARTHHLRTLIEYPEEVVYIGDADSYNEFASMTRASRCTQGEWSDSWAQKSPGKIIFMSDDENLIKIENILSTHTEKIEFSRSRNLFLDITRRGVNKGHALQVLASYYDMPLDQIVAIGDGWNDKSMFEVAGYAIAMGSGEKKLHQFADLVTPPEINNGFEWALERVVSWIE